MKPPSDVYGAGHACHGLMPRILLLPDNTYFQMRLRRFRVYFVAMIDPETEHPKAESLRTLAAVAGPLACLWPRRKQSCGVECDSFRAKPTATERPPYFVSDGSIAHASTEDAQCHAFEAHSLFHGDGDAKWIEIASRTFCFAEVLRLPEFRWRPWSFGAGVGTVSSRQADKVRHHFGAKLYVKTPYENCTSFGFLILRPCAV